MNFCDCGNEAMRKVGSGWVCQRCYDLDERHRYDLRAASVVERSPARPTGQHYFDPSFPEYPQITRQDKPWRFSLWLKRIEAA